MLVSALKLQQHDLDSRGSTPVKHSELLAQPGHVKPARPNHTQTVTERVNAEVSFRSRQWRVAVKIPSCPQHRQRFNTRVRLRTHANHTNTRARAHTHTGARAGRRGAARTGDVAGFSTVAGVTLVAYPCEIAVPPTEVDAARYLRLGLGDEQCF